MMMEQLIFESNYFFEFETIKNQANKAQLEQIKLKLLGRSLDQILRRFFAGSLPLLIDY